MASPHDLRDLAWHVNSLLQNKDTLERFREQCQVFLEMSDLDDDRPPPLRFDREGEWEHDPKPPLLLCEQYAILAALHEIVCFQVEHVDPVPWPKGPNPDGSWPEGSPLPARNSKLHPVVRDSLGWAAHVINAEDLDERDRYPIQACLDEVERDLKLIGAAVPPPPPPPAPISPLVIVAMPPLPAHVEPTSESAQIIGKLQQQSRDAVSVQQKHPTTPTSPEPIQPPKRPGRPSEYDDKADTKLLADYNARPAGETSQAYEERVGLELGSIERAQARVRKRTNSR